MLNLEYAKAAVVKKLTHIVEPVCSHITRLLVVLFTVTNVFAGPNEDLIEGADKKDAAMVQRALRAGAEVDTLDKDGDTALHAVAGNGATKIVEILIKSNTDVNRKDHNNNTALMYAASNGHLPIVNLLLKAGADANWQGQLGNTALIGSVLGGHPKITQVLIKSGANVDLPAANGDTSICVAVYRDKIENLKILLRAKANPNLLCNEKGMTALMFAAALGKQEAAQLLIKAKADISIRSKDGQTALFHADAHRHSTGSSSISDLLRAAGATE